MSGLFNKNLLKLDFGTSKESRFVLLVSQKTDNDLTPTELFALEDAETFKATAVYFRHFPDNRSPIPQIYVYDNTQDTLNEDDLANIHRDLWSNCRIPVFIVVEKTTIKFFDTRKPVKVFADNRIETKSFDQIDITDDIDLIADATKLYSRKLFDSGIFWETEKAKGHFLEKTSAYRDLIENLKTVRKVFFETTNLPKETSNKLLVFSILIKYLEERGNEGESLFAHNFFQKLGAKDFCDVLRQRGKIVDLFDKLSQHFNGKIFVWTNDKEKSLVAKTNLNNLADFLDADITLETGQYSFWRKYSFNHLPVELISTVYETFLNERKDAVYTPEFLVNTLIDESMPQNEYEKSSIKTIDVSCGSGIFLVSAFKRLTQRHRYKKFKETGELKNLKSDELLEIIKKNIFGVDIEEDAIRLTVFSLCLALCDELKPKEIWDELKFDKTFETNFKADNFFSYLENNKDRLGTFDLVIGNPPFISLSKDKSGNYFKDENGDYFGTYKEKNSEGEIEKKKVYLNKEILLNSKKKIYPDNQTALMFLDQSPQLLKETGLLCLIMPAAPLLYNNSFEFRKHFFPKHQVFQILDFTNLDTILFEANVPTAAIFVRNQEHNAEEPITHVTIRRTRSVEDKIFFEIDKYDFHYVSQNDASNDKHVWKSNLLGGGRLHNLVKRLSDLNSIDDYVYSKKDRGWISGEGYQVKGNRKLKSADYITDKPTIPTRKFTENGFEEFPVTTESSKLFLYPRKKELYQPPHLLIKENLGKKKIPIHFSDKYLTFKDSIIGIAAPKSEREDLYKLYKSLDNNNNLYRFYIITTSNEFSVGRGTSILEQDIMNLPYPEDKEEMQLSFVEQIICDDVLDYYIEIKKKSSTAKMNKFAQKDDLEEYGKVFNKMLNSIYGKSGKCFYLKKIYDWNEFFVTEFDYGVNTNDVEFKPINKPTEAIKSLIETEYGTNAFLIKVLKLYKRNKVYLIKPKALRYWLKSIAIKDADETFSDLLKAGY